MQQKSGYECSENPEEGVVISKRVKLVVRRLRAFLVEMIGNLNVRHNVRLPTAAGSTQSATICRICKWHKVLCLFRDSSTRWWPLAW